jgi:K+-transporting ATPase ATPase B chain
LIPTTIGGLQRIGIAGMNRLIKEMSLFFRKSCEAAGDVDILLLDKTRTITLGNRMAFEFIAENSSMEHLQKLHSCLHLLNETPEAE